MAEAQPLPEVEAGKAGKAGPAKKSKLPLLIIAVVVLAGGGGAAWWFMRGTPAKAAAQAEPAPDPADRGLVSFDPFLVNLADPGGGRFLKTTIQLVVSDPKASEKLKETPVVVSQARSEILELLTLQTADTLVTPDGKQALKDAIKERVGKTLAPMKVVDVLFSEFVVQF